MLSEGAEARAEAADWLRVRSATLPLSGGLSSADRLPPFDDLAASAQIVGLGEATHGSRELGDLRLSLVRRLVERHGYRLIAIEDSASRWRALEHYIAGETSKSMDAPLEWGWIGRRPRRELLEWVRQWNLSNPNDRIQIVGVDPQDNRHDIDRLGRFLERAYGDGVHAEWRAQAEELSAADEQTDVFGYSGVSGALRQFLQHIAFQLTSDDPLLRERFGDQDYEQALEAARDMAAFADFNSRDETVSHSRDRYMALGILRAVEEGGRPKTIFWAHNAHVSAAPSENSTGAMLREVVGCAYRSIATTFGRGDFIALVANDPKHRLATSTLRAASHESVEGILAEVRPGAHLSTWPCQDRPDQTPAWLRTERPLRSVGGIWTPGAPSSTSYTPVELTVAFDAIAYVPHVAAEDIPPDLPIVPARERPVAARAMGPG
jgi:erythromycin esterase